MQKASEGTEETRNKINNDLGVERTKKGQKLCFHAITGNVPVIVLRILVAFKLSLNCKCLGYSNMFEF